MCIYCEVKRSKYDISDVFETGALICMTGDYDACVVIAQKDDEQFYFYLYGHDEDFSEAISFCPFCGKKLKQYINYLTFNTFHLYILEH